MRTNLLANKKRRTTRSISAEKDDENRLFSPIITGVQNASRNKPRLSGEVTHLPTNGSREQVSFDNRSNNSSKRNNTEDRSVEIYDHLGKEGGIQHQYRLTLYN